MTSRFKGPLISRWWRLLDIIGGKDIVGRLAWLPAFIRDTDVLWLLFLLSALSHFPQLSLSL